MYFLLAVQGSSRLDIAQLVSSRSYTPTSKRASHYIDDRAVLKERNPFSQGRDVSRPRRNFFKRFLFSETICVVGIRCLASNSPSKADLNLVVERRTICSTMPARMA
ncbi:hypothetical protein CC2G_014631 [Coprinopsis cinerea AmutBmut pab1-1]|nr:hypothetical protein CC2G_014631 [Coprinopsis cinerea AmutBmut pab1-1]